MRQIKLYTVNLCLDQEALAAHLLGLFNAHGSKDRWCDITKNTLVTLLEAPALGGVGQDEGNLVQGVGGLWCTLFVDHFLGVSRKEWLVKLL